MDIRKNPEYIQLNKDTIKASQEFHVASKMLKKGYFLEIDQKVKEIEEKTKESFLDIIDKDIKDCLIDFKFSYDPSHFLFLGKVNHMIFSKLHYDLGFWASQFPEDMRDHDYLTSVSKDYRETFKDMEKKLIELCLHPSSRPCQNSKIEKFLEKNRIEGIVPKYFA